MKDNTAQPPNSTSTAAQRQRLREYLYKHGKITTLQARALLDIVSPAPRIFELRHDERLNIITNRRVDHTPDGSPHLVAEYVLMPGLYIDHIARGHSQGVNHG